jgi:hypothetical protein
MLRSNCIANSLRCAYSAGLRVGCLGLCRVSVSDAGLSSQTCPGGSVSRLSTAPASSEDWTAED